MRRPFLYAIGCLLLISASPVHGCNIPVFRYALERWKSDPVEVFVFHNEEFTRAEQEKLDQYQSSPVVAAGLTNAELQIYDVRTELPESASLLWDQLSDRQVELPVVAIRTRIAGQSRSHWHRPLLQTDFSSLVTSPRREAITDRLLAGHAIVWVMLDGPDHEANEQVAAGLKQQLDQLAQQISLPAGVGLPGSELFADVPLLLQFSVLRIGPGEAAEGYLTDLMRSSNGAAESGPLVMPVFGRGRAFSVLSADDLTDNLLEDIVVYLCGACSCQVKEQNPGFDLLMSTNWDQRLFGDFATALPPMELAHVSSAPPSAAPNPALIDIPAGRTADTPTGKSADTAVAATVAGRPSRQALAEQGTMISLMIALMVLIVIALSVARRVDI